MELLQNKTTKNRMITTDRLLLRPFSLLDRYDVFEYAGDPIVTEKLRFKTPASLEKSMELIYTDYQRVGVFAIEYKENHKCIGCIDIRLNDEKSSGEIGYVFNRNYWNKGLMSEALQGMIDYGFNVLHLKKINARHDLDNPTSRRVMQKCHMKKAAMNVQEAEVKGIVHDAAYYTIARAEYLKQRKEV